MIFIYCFIIYIISNTISISCKYISIVINRPISIYHLQRCMGLFWQTLEPENCSIQSIFQHIGMYIYMLYMYIYVYDIYICCICYDMCVCIYVYKMYMYMFIYDIYMLILRIGCFLKAYVR